MNRRVVVEEIREESAFVSLRGEWDDLLRGSEGDFLFLTHDWLACWWRHFGREGSGRGTMDLYVLLARESGRLCAAAPLVIETLTAWKVPVRLVRFLGHGVSDYSEFLAEKGSGAGVEAILGHLAARAGLWDVLLLEELRPSPGNDDLIRRCLERRDLRTQTAPGSTCPFVRIRGDWNDHYSQRFSSDTRRRQERYRRSLRKEGDVRFSKVAGLEGGTGILDRLAETERRHPQHVSDRKGILNADIHRDFFREFLPRASANGWLSIFLLSCDDRVACYYLTFRYGDRHYLYATAYDRDFSKYSVGRQLMLMMLEDLWSGDGAVVDFLRGDAPFKQDLADDAGRNATLISWPRSLSGRAKGRIWSLRHRGSVVGKAETGAGP